MSSPTIVPSVPAHLRRGGIEDERESVVEARALIEHMCAAVGWPDLGGRDVLDMGCGTRFTQAICSFDLPLGTYTGVDIEDAILDLLRAEVDDERFRFVTHAVQNDLYNRDGERRTGDVTLPLPEEAFDLVCGFSLFTHLDPVDFAAMARLMRRHVRPDGHLFFTAYLNEQSAGGHGLIDSWAAKLGPRGALDDVAEAEPPDFVDLTPDRPLLHAVFGRRHACALVEAAGWEIVDILEPSPMAQHQFVCRPA